MKSQLTSLEKTYHYSVLTIITLLLATPILATFLYALATQWGATVLPSGLTLKWFSMLWHDKRFLIALSHSLTVCISSLVFTLLIIIPSVFTVHYYYPKLKGIMNIIITLPFVIPPIVSSVGLLNLYSDGPLAISGTPWILIACYFTIALPFVYRSLDNSFQAIALHDLMDSARLMGASNIRAIVLVILPNIKKGLFVAFFLSFSFLMGEFVFANILVGGQYETLQVYLYSIKNVSGHHSSAVVITYFMLIFFSTLIASLLQTDKK